MATDDEKNQAKADAALAEYHQHRDKGFDDGGAAYPFPIHDSEGQISANAKTGMTLLDHFAETMWRPSEDMADIKDITGSISREVAEGCERAAARQAYAYAKSMIEEKRRLEKEATS